MSRERYKNWTIEFNPKPMSDLRFDYDYWHDDYDGEGSCGNTSSVEEARKEIDEFELLGR